MDMDFAHLLCGDCYALIYLHTEADPAHDQWNQSINQIETLKAKVSGDMTKFRSLVVTDGGAPDTVQRRQITEVFGGKVKSAAVTTVLSNPIKRGIATAILWLNPEFRAFAPNQFTHALKHLNLESHNAAIVAVLKKLQLKMPPNQTLKILLQENGG